MSTLSVFPTELLCSIVRFAVEPASAFPTELVSLSHVCRLLRFITLDLPDLWAFVQNTQCDGRLEAHLARSKDTPLSVEICINTEYEECENFLEMTIPSHHRWKEFHFEIEVDFSGWQSVFCAVEFALRGMYCPALELLAATFPDPAEEFDEPYEYSFLNSLAFYKSWVTPKLRTLTSINAIPYSSAGQTLTTCNIDVTTYDRYHAALSPLLCFLTYSKKLKKLDIHLGRGIFRIDKDGLERLPGIINLAELDHFGIVINCCNPDHVFHTFMRQILLPRVSKMFVYLNHREAVDIDNWIGALFITNKRYPSLRTLSIQNYLRPREENKSFPLQMILERIPHLNRLSITSPHIGLPESIQGITFPLLHTLTVIECKDLQIGFIKQLSSSLQLDTRRWAVFEKLTIARCQGIQKEELIDVFPQDKLHFHPA